MIIETGRGKLPIRYGWNALARFGDLTGKSMDEVFDIASEKTSVSDLLLFILVGFQEGARKAGEECRVSSVEEVGDMLDEDPTITGKVIEAFAAMAHTGEVSEGEEKPKKK